MAYKAREGEYRYYAAVSADIEPLPSSYRPNPHPLCRTARKEMYDLSRKLRKLESQIEKTKRRGGVVPRGRQREHDECLARLKELSQMGRGAQPLPGLAVQNSTARSVKSHGAGQGEPQIILRRAISTRNS
jgi:hypothetical protein